jgi:pimeloyl-ACP methyl ester carboxylesterase
MVQVWLAPGASGTPASMAPWVEGLVARGIDAATVALPRGLAERAVRRFSDQVPDAPGMVVGGRSFGGRVASLLAAGGTGVPSRAHPVAALVALSYPLHRPGRPDPGLARAAHWPALAAPALLLSGAADPFADPALLRAAAARLPRGELVLYKGLGHDLAAVREDVLDRIAVFVRALEGAGGGPGAERASAAPTAGPPGGAVDRA